MSQVSLKCGQTDLDLKWGIRTTGSLQLKLITDSRRVRCPLILKEQPTESTVLTLISSS
jgi:hypothetical protein